jgi:hypothetical protein
MTDWSSMNTTHAPQADAATLDEMKNQDVPAFTHKLRRVLAGRSRVEIAELTGAKPGTARAWLSQGSVPRPGQIALLAEHAGCSIGYLCDDRIPVDADPKEGGGVSFTDGELVARLRSRYIEEAERLHDYLDEIQGIDWCSVGDRLLASEPTDAMPPDIARAAEVLTAMRVLWPHTIGPFLPVFNADCVDEHLRPDAIKRRMDGLAYAQTVRVVMDLLPVRRGVAAAIRSDAGGDMSGSLKLFDELRAELAAHEESGAHLLETCAGVLEAGGVDQYAAQCIARIHGLAAEKVKAGEIKSADAEVVARAVPGLILEVIKEDLARQASYEGKADQAWRLTSGTKPEAESVRRERITARAGQRAALLGEAINNYLGRTQD